MSDIPSTVFQPSSLDQQGFEKFDKSQKNEGVTPTTGQRLPAVTKDEAAAKYAGPTSKPTSAKELYVAQSLGSDQEYQRKLKSLSGRGSGSEAAVAALLAERTAHHANYWDNNLHESQKADFANQQVEKGGLDASQSVNTSRLDAFRAKQNPETYRPPGDPRADQDMANAELAKNNSPEAIQERRGNAGLTAGSTPEEVAQNRAILQGKADERTARGQGPNPMIGRVTGATTNTGAGGDVTTTRYQPATPTADQAKVAAASQAANAAVRDPTRNDADNQGGPPDGVRVPGRESSFVMSGAEFNAAQERGATKNNPAQHTNDQKVFVRYKPSEIGGVGQYEIQGGANNVPGYTTPNTLAGSRPGTINGMPGQEAIAQQKATNAGEKAAAESVTDLYQQGGIKPGSPISAMLKPRLGSDEPSPYNTTVANTMATSADAERVDRQSQPLKEKKGKPQLAADYKGPEVVQNP
jgi:hypothetical protein